MKTIGPGGSSPSCQTTDYSQDAAMNATRDARNDSWDDLNSSVDSLSTFLTVSSILLGVLGIVMVGASIISYIGGAFGRD